MKILIICNFSSGLVLFRGMLLETLIQQKHTVSAVIPQTDDAGEIASERALAAIGCRLVRVPMERRGMNPLKDLGLMRNYVKIIKSGKPDLVITYTIKPNAYGGLACRLCRVSYAANVTGLGTAFQENGLLRKFVTVLYKTAFKKAKVVFFENEDNRDTIVNAGIIERNRTHILHGAGVDLEKFAYRKYPKDEGETRFLFIGRVMKEKGVDELFSAMQKLKADGIPCHLDLLGWLDEDYGSKIKEGENEGWLTYHGYQSDVRPFIADCHCFVLPSWHEGMANTNLECAASGRPVITSNVHGCQEAVEDGVSGLLCCCRKSNDLYAVMKRFCALPAAQKAAMGVAGRKRMEAVFDKRKVVEETIEVLIKE